MTHSIDFEALRARRAEGILYGFDAPEAADWLDDWGGLHTLDDGHDGSYAHEALATTDSVTVTLTCQCGEWSGSAPADTDEEPADLFGAWEAHVYAATGRWQADDTDTYSTYSDPAVRDAIRSLTDSERRVMAALDVHHGDPVRARDEAVDEPGDAEVEQLRAELAAEREQATRAARDGLARLQALKAENKDLAEALDEAIAANAVLGAEVERFRSVIDEFTTAVLADAEGEAA